MALRRRFVTAAPRNCAKRLANQAPFAEELAWPENRDHRFLALLGRDHNLDLALLDVENRVRDSRLQEGHLVLVQVGHGVPATYGGEKGFWIEGGLGFPGHDFPYDGLVERIVCFWTLAVRKNPRGVVS
jgi:hypothetical protein